MGVALPAMDAKSYPLSGTPEEPRNTDYHKCVIQIKNIPSAGLFICKVGEVLRGVAGRGSYRNCSQSILELQTYAIRFGFRWVCEFSIPILTLVWQALYPKNHVHSSVCST